MKKSVYEAARRSYWLRMQQESLDAYPRAVARAAEDVAAVEAAGYVWDPEDEAWPEIGTVVMGYHQGGDWCVLAPPEKNGFDRQMVRGLPAAQAERIARAWNARRPGGRMEESLLALAREAGSYNEFTARFAKRIDAALRLGIDVVDLETPDCDLL